VLEGGQREVHLAGDALLGLLEDAGVEHELLERADISVRDDRAVPEVALTDLLRQAAQPAASAATTP